MNPTGGRGVSLRMLGVCTIVCTLAVATAASAPAQSVLGIVRDEKGKAARDVQLEFFPAHRVDIAWPSLDGPTQEALRAATR